MRDHTHAGEAHGSLALIHLNATYVTAGGGWTRDALESTTAHELGHLLDAWMQARHYPESIELRRELGRHFGVATLEHALRGNAEEDAVARAQLVAEVSEYAGTNTVEAFAELFKLWWRRDDEPSRAVSLFGELMDRYLPVPAGSR